MGSDSAVCYGDRDIFGKALRFPSMSRRIDALGNDHSSLEKSSIAVDFRSAVLVCRVRMKWDRFIERFQGSWGGNR
jgi:hypothetical protein